MAKIKRDDVGGVWLGCCVDPAQYVWMIVSLFAFTVFVILICCISSVAARWIYKRRMRKKCDGLRDKYRLEGIQRKEDALKARKVALQPVKQNKVDPTTDALAKFVELGIKQQQSLMTTRGPSAEFMKQLAAQLAPPAAPAPAPGPDQGLPPPAPVLLTSAEKVLPLPMDKQEPANTTDIKNKQPPSAENAKTTTNIYRTPVNIFEGFSIQNSVRPSGEVLSKELKVDEVNVSLKNGKETQSKESTNNSMETIPTGSSDTVEERTQSSPEVTPPGFPYFSEKGRNDRTRRSAWPDNTLSDRTTISDPRNPPERSISSYSSISNASYKTAATRPPNAYDLRRKVLERTLPPLPDSSDASLTGGSSESKGNVGPSAKGFSHLRNLNTKDKEDCLKSISYPGLPRSRCG